LNGNRYIALVLWFVLSSCHILRSDPVPPPVTGGENDQHEIVHTDPGKTDPAIEQEETLPEIETKNTVEFHGELFQVANRQEEFDVALILPFYLNEPSDKVNATAKIMLEYYQGVKLALKELEEMGMQLRLHVFDNKNDTSETHRILIKSELRKMDLIIGPILESHLQIVSDFSLKHKIPLFSPFSRIDELNRPNPYLYTSIPGNKLMAEQIVEHWAANYPDSKVIILNDSSWQAKRSIPLVVEALKRNGKLMYNVLGYSSSLDWEKKLRQSGLNLVYIPTNNRRKVSSSLGRIFAAKREVTVYGEQSWSNFEDCDYNFWNKLNVHLITHEFQDVHDTNRLAMRKQFRTMFREDPGVYANMGYDQMRFIGEFLMTFGEHFPMYLDGRSFKYSISTYRFNEYDGFRQNHHLYFLRFEDFRLREFDRS